MVNNKIYINLVAIIFCLLKFAPFLSAQTMNDGSRYAANSVLASGKWIQMTVKDNAIYKLTYDDIKKQGISDPSKVKIYGYGGWILPEDFSQPYIDDLPEVAVYMDKGSDGVFSSGDYLLFYGRGTTKWTYNSTTKAYEHENNPYSTYGSYFMTESDTGPKEMDTVPFSALPSALPLTVFSDYAVYEKDSISILNSGRELFGESFVSNSGKQSFVFTIPGITSDTSKARLSFAAAPSVPTPVNLSIDGQSISTLTVNVPGDYYTKASLVSRWDVWAGDKAEKVTATVTYNSAGQSIAYLNFIELNMKRALQFYPVAYTFFRDTLSLLNAVTYSIGNPTASCQIWDVTPNNDTRIMATQSNNGQMEFSTPASGTLREFAMVDLSKTFPTPEFIGTVQNQNLHALPQTDMVILTPTVYMQQAQALADKHTQQGLRVSVVDDRLIFNEFSSGIPDATAYRRFMKMFYDRATTDADKPKYLLLFGGGIFDNRHLTSAGAKLDPKYYLLTYQVKESVNETTSYGTDDYFGFLDDNEGANIGMANLDIGIGRFPVSSVAQASDAVNKISAYMDNTQYGKWKTNLIFAADMASPSNNDPAFVHVRQADSLADYYVGQNYPEYMLNKIYIDSYQLVNVNGKLVAPDAKQALLNQLDDGCFLLNYTGHGSTTAWSAEDLLNITDVRQMKFKNLPLWITATCDFGWFDGFDTSGGETAFLNTNSGAISLFTTSRVVSSSSNFNLNIQFIRYLFNKQAGKYLPLGDIFRLSKNQLGYDSNKLNFVLLGDPALTLNYPQWNIRLDSINGNPVSDNEAVELNALSRVTFSGVVTDESGTIADNFSGTLNATVFDSQKAYNFVSGGTAFSYTAYPGAVYSGSADVQNGAFSFTFNVPKDISYSNTNGKVGMYAYDDSLGIDAFGSFTQYYLSGTTTDSIDFSKYPEIETMFLNAENFRDGDPVNETPFFYAKVMDDYGINLTGNKIHDMLLTIDNNPSWTYYLNSFYQEIDATQGTVGFPIPELPAGQHRLTFKVWNILNNSTTDTLNFTVIKGYKPVIVDLQAYGNPASISTLFVLSHNLPETTLKVDIGVYDLAGRIVWTHSETGSSGFMQNYEVQWPLTNNGGSRVQPGVYLYRATVSTSSSKEVTRAKKIIVLKQ